MTQSKKKYILIAIGVLVLSFSSICFYNREWIKEYYTDIQSHPFKEGDKIYAERFYSLAQDDMEFLFYRLIKSANSSEKQLKYDGIHINVSAFKKMHSTYIGHFVQREFFHVDISKGDKRFDGIVKCYEIIPDKSLVEYSAESKEVMPAGYDYANDRIYVFSEYTNTKNTFR